MPDQPDTPSPLAMNIPNTLTVSRIILIPVLVVISGKVMPKVDAWRIRRIRSTPATMLPHWSLPPICRRQP